MGDIAYGMRREVASGALFDLDDLLQPDRCADRQVHR